MKNRLYFWCPDSKKEQTLSILKSYENFFKSSVDVFNLLKCKSNHELIPEDWDSSLIFNLYDCNNENISIINSEISFLYSIIPFIIYDISKFEDEIQSLFSKSNELSDFITIDKTVKINKLDQLLNEKQVNYINKKEKYLKSLIDISLSKKDEKPLHFHQLIENSINFLNKEINVPYFILPSQKELVSQIIFNERVTQLLHSQVEIAYFINSEINPVDGWLNYETKENLTSLTNPFLSINLDSNLSGNINIFEYFPRKILLNDGFSSLYGTIGESHYLNDNLQSPSSVRIMRKQPDLFALRFDEDLSNALNLQNKLKCTKVIYIKSGLGSFMPNSTSGLSVDYWLESSNNNIEKTRSYENENFNLCFPILFPGTSNTISIRALTSMGGEDEKLHKLTLDVNQIASEDISGKIFGLRLINSVNHFVIDFRFAHALDKASFKIDYETKFNTKIFLAFTQKINSIFEYEKLQTLYLTIY